MGIMPCSRRGCDSILCDIYSSKYGYICRNCYNELLDTYTSIASFMNTPKPDTGYRVPIEEHRRIVREEFGEE